MKNEITMAAEVYELLGFPIPLNHPVKQRYRQKNEIKNVLKNKEERSAKDFSYLEQGICILDLARKKNYHTETFTLLKAVDILKLPYNQVPTEIYRQCDYFIKVIKKYVKTKLSVIGNWEAFQEEGLPFLNLILGTYMQKIHITRPVELEAYSLEICRKVFECQLTVMIQFDDMPDFKCFGGIGDIKKKKSSYYYYKKEKCRKTYLVDTYELVSYLALFNSIYMLVSNTESELMTNYLASYISVLEKCYSGDEYVQLKQLLTEQELVPTSSLFYYAFSKSQCRQVPFLNPSRSILKMFTLIFFDALQLYNDITYEKKYREQIEYQSAPPYVTKKNIPLKVFKAMEESDFNQYFGYVEFDQDMDLNTVKLIEKEFKNINKEFFYGLVFKNVILRFRKLGRQKAGGLYYFLLNTLCVDIHSPGSFVHEYWHMIDDQRNDLSLKPEFNKVVVVYRSAFLNNMMNLSPEEKKFLKGNSKYNIKYFFRRAEIFAYCGEIYMSRILHIESSLLHSLDISNVAYPQNRQLDNEIELYFKRLFIELKNGS